MQPLQELFRHLNRYLKPYPSCLAWKILHPNDMKRVKGSLFRRTLYQSNFQHLSLIQEFGPIIQQEILCLIDKHYKLLLLSRTQGVQARLFLSYRQDLRLFHPKVHEHLPNFHLQHQLPG